MTVLRSGSATDVGRVRSVNEDLALEGSSLFAVADGMGGHVGGEVAARTAIESLRSGFEHAPSVDGLVEAVHDANDAVWEKSHADPALRGMGTTLIAAALVGTEDGDRLVVANVGDSRAYRLHGDELGQLTIDHSVAEELVARGELSEREAAVHPHRHILTRALGVDPDVDVDVWELVPEQGDRFLLCSDGLSNELSADDMGRVLVDTSDPKEAAEKLVDMANESGGNDNITVVVLDVLVGEPTSADADGATAAAATAPAASSDGEPSGATAVMGRSEEAKDEEAVTRRGPAHPGRPRRQPARRITFRVLLFLIVLGALGYGAYAAVKWYVDSSYFVGYRNGHVVVFQGRPGGFLGMKPKVVQNSGIKSTQVPSNLQSALSSGVEEPSKQAATTYVANLYSLLCAQVPPPTGLICPPPATAPRNSVTPTTRPRSATRQPDAGGEPVRGSRYPFERLA